MWWYMTMLDQIFAYQIVHLSSQRHISFSKNKGNLRPFVVGGTTGVSFDVTIQYSICVYYTPTGRE